MIHLNGTPGAAAGFRAARGKGGMLTGALLVVLMSASMIRISDDVTVNGASIRCQRVLESAHGSHVAWTSRAELLQPGDTSDRARWECVNTTGHRSQVDGAALCLPPIRISIRGGRWLLSMIAAIVLLSGLSLVGVAARRRHQLYVMAARARRAERQRIARDLHDTFLQAVQALLFRLQGWGADKNLPDPLRQEIATVADQARTIVHDGRERIQALRRAERYDTEIHEQLEAMRQDGARSTPPHYLVETVGSVCNLTPETFDTVLEIAQEAVRNAYAHAQASYIRLSVEYHKSGLTLIVADDGKGIDQKKIDSSAELSSFGLLGMHERAAQLGATLAIGANGQSGCRVRLRVPPRIAFVPRGTSPVVRRDGTKHR